MKNEKTKWLEVHLNKAQGPIGKQDGLCLSIGNEGSGVTRQIAGVHTGIYDVVRTWRVDRAELLAAVEAPDISLTEYEAQRAAIAAAADRWKNWLPTAENINGLPEPIRKFIHDIETNADPAQTMRENTILKDTVAALAKRVEELEVPPDDTEAAALKEEKACTRKPE